MRTAVLIARAWTGTMVLVLGLPDTPGAEPARAARAA
jgi:hypothetical protein